MVHLTLNPTKPERRLVSYLCQIVDVSLFEIADAHIPLEPSVSFSAIKSLMP